MTKKRRTRKEKELAKHSLYISWPGTQKLASVKGQFKNEKKVGSPLPTTSKSAKNTAKDDSYARIKRDLVKSILIASLVLCLEVVLYLFQ